MSVGLVQTANNIHILCTVMRCALGSSGASCFLPSGVPLIRELS